MNLITVSIVVPTYRRNQLLERCLMALVAQQYDPRQFEILVVDDACAEDTRRLVESWAENTTALQFSQELVANTVQKPAGSLLDTSPPNLWIEQTVLQIDSLPKISYLAVGGPNHGPAAARNLGWQSARGEIIAFTDDDCIPQPNWLREGVGAMTGLDGVTGRIIVPLQRPPSDYELNASGLETSQFVTANCFYRKELLALCGGFDERFQTAWREDSDLFFTALEKGFRLGITKSAEVIHPVRPAQWGISLKQQRKNQYNALLYRKHPRLYRRYIQARPPVHYYLIIAATGLAAAGVIAHMPQLAILGLVCWLAITAWFCLNRLKNTSHHPSHVIEMIFTSLLIPFVAVFWRLAGAFRFKVFFL